MGQDIKKKVDVPQKTFKMFHYYAEIIMIIDTLVVSINKLGTNDLWRPFFKDLMKSTKNINVGCLFLKVLYYPIVNNVTLVVYSVLLYEVT